MLCCDCRGLVEDGMVLSIVLICEETVNEASIV